MDDPLVLSSIAAACVAAGARGVRVEGLANCSAAARRIDSLVIGLCKGVFPDGRVRITRDIGEVEGLISCGVSCVAVDGTAREHGSVNGPSFISFCRGKFPDAVLLADIAREDEAEACMAAGAHAVATTLRGYTADTMGLSGNDPSFIRSMVSRGIPVVAEGGIASPQDFMRCMDAGAMFCVVGRAITDMGWVVSRFLGAND